MVVEEEEEGEEEEDEEECVRVEMQSDPAQEEAPASLHHWH